MLYLEQVKLNMIKPEQKNIEKMAKELDKISKYNTLLSRVINEIMVNQQISYEKRHWFEEETGSYPFMPLPLSVQMSSMLLAKKSLAKKKNKIRFLDAGCGCGNTILMARAVDLAQIYHGIEFCNDTADKAEAILRTDRHPSIRIFREDIMTFKNYERYDIIYYYCPFCNKELQAKFEKLVEDQMRVGALLMPFMKLNNSIEKDDRFESIDGVYDRMFIKIKD